MGPQHEGHGRDRRRYQPHHRHNEVVQRHFIKAPKYTLKILIITTFNSNYHIYHLRGHLVGLHCHHGQQHHHEGDQVHD